jgi:hypothetical protein
VERDRKGSKKSRKYTDLRRRKLIKEKVPGQKKKLFIAHHHTSKHINAQNEMN